MYGNRTGNIGRSGAGYFAVRVVSKTLFIQLERLGDLIQTTPLLVEYRAANPDVEIHLLMLDENRSALTGFGGVDHYHYLQLKMAQSSQSVGF